MAYFSNGSEGMDYQERYCNKCIHDVDNDCPVWLLHIMHNHEECNKLGSFLHVLIPRAKGELTNEQCKMFTPMEGRKFTHRLPAGLPLELKAECETKIEEINRIIERKD